MTVENSQMQLRCRVFIGNLATEKTTLEEVSRIFSKYGRLAETPVFHRSFGFVQYEEEAAAQRAIEAENSLVGGLKTELSFAESKPGRQKMDKRRKGKRGRNGANSLPGKRLKYGIQDGSDGLCPSFPTPGFAELGPAKPGRDWREEPSFSPPDSINDVFIARVDSPTPSFCLMIEKKITDLDLLYETRDVPDERDLPAVLRAAAERSTVKHIMVVGRRLERDWAVSMSSRLPNGEVGDFLRIPLERAFALLATPLLPAPPPALPRALRSFSSQDQAWGLGPYPPPHRPREVSGPGRGGLDAGGGAMQALGLPRAYTERQNANPESAYPERPSAYPERPSAYPGAVQSAYPAFRLPPTDPLPPPPSSGPANLAPSVPNRAAFSPFADNTQGGGGYGIPVGGREEQGLAAGGKAANLDVTVLQDLLTATAPLLQPSQPPAEMRPPRAGASAPQYYDASTAPGPLAQSGQPLTSLAAASESEHAGFKLPFNSNGNHSSAPERSTPGSGSGPESSSWSASGPGPSNAELLRLLTRGGSLPVTA